MSSIWIDNINTITQSKSNHHFLLFGPQNNPWGKKIYSENIGDFVCFRVPKTITKDNWSEFNWLHNYFEKINFDPCDIMMSDCSTCGDRWEDEDVRTVDTYDEVVNEFKTKNLIDNMYNKYMVIHNLKIENDSVISSKITKIGEPDYLMSENDVQQIYQHLVSLNKRKYY